MRLFLHLIQIPLLLITSSIVGAENLYKWQDEQGITHYSDRAIGPDAKIADPPKINRGETKLPNLPASCDRHGGIDCTKGADIDGSVICTDDFKDALARFNFRCLMSKLEVLEVAQVSDHNIKVVIRNLSSVAALQPKIQVKLGNGIKLPQLSGPQKIDPYEVTEFLGELEAPNTQKLKPADIIISCLNCP